MLWERNKHDAKVAAAKAKDGDHIREEIQSKIAKAWQQKTLTLTQKRKSSPESFEERANKMLAEMESLVRRQCSGHPELREYEEMTIMLLQEKVEQLRLVGVPGFWRANCFTPYVPSFARPEQDSSSLPRPAQAAVVRFTFNTEDEFKDIAPVRNVMLKDGFVGFVLNESAVWAVFDDNESVPVGTVANSLGLEKVPGLKDWQKALKKQRRKN